MPSESGSTRRTASPLRADDENLPWARILRFLLWALLCLLAAFALTDLGGCAPLIVHRDTKPEYSILTTSAPASQAWDQERCDKAEGHYSLWGGVAAGAAGGAGLGGLSAALPDGQGVRVALGSASLAVAILSAVAIFERDQSAHQITAHCDGGEAETSPASPQ